MHGWLIAAFICFILAALLTAFKDGGRYPFILLCCGLAVELVPTVFNLTN